MWYNVMMKCTECSKSIEPHPSWTNELVKENTFYIFCDSTCIRKHFKTNT